MQRESSQRLRSAKGLRLSIGRVLSRAIKQPTHAYDLHSTGLPWPGATFVEGVGRRRRDGGDALTADLWVRV